MKTPKALKRTGLLLKEFVLRMATARLGLRRVVNGLEYRVDSSCRNQFVAEYEPGAATFLRKHITPGALIFNIGANVGVLTLQLARLTGPTGKVVAFEPNPNAIRLLKKNVRLNRLETQVDVVEVAIGDTVRDIPLYYFGANGMARTARANPLLAKTQTVVVPMTTLDVFCKSHGLIPDWIVMDIEGSEVSALRGGQQLLGTKARQIGIVVEVHPDAWSWSGDSKADMEDILSNLGRKSVALGGQADPLSEHGQVYLESCAHAQPAGVG